MDGCLQTLGSGHSGPSNPRAVGFQLAQNNIRAAIMEAFKTAGKPRQPVEMACLCLAGAGRQEERQVIQEWVLSQQIARRAQLVSEAEAVLAMLDPPATDSAIASGDTADIALICGTGSLAWGHIPGTNRQARSGGWGYMLGDEGSAFWLGQQLATRVCRASDGRSRHDAAIEEKLLKYLELTSTSDLIAWCYGGSDSRHNLANLAPLVFEDPESDWSKAILLEGAQELANMISAVIESLKVKHYRLAIAGGVIVLQPEYLEMVFDKLPCRPAQWQFVNDPAAGALRLSVERGAMAGFRAASPTPPH
jgi:N-acetylglucosamine kinase-like BadF-type ATPase